MDILTFLSQRQIEIPFTACKCMYPTFCLEQQMQNMYTSAHLKGYFNAKPNLKYAPPPKKNKQTSEPLLINIYQMFRAIKYWCILN